ncbi:MAG: HNH endonuclease, partial [Propionibacterium sp.]|nr:HNH endonuclease [Propionibacterium sp.]
DPPASMRLAMQIRNPFDVAPYGTRAARHCDADHTEPYRTGLLGQTRLGNLGPLSRRAHRAKTFGGWQLVQTGEDGIFHWRSPFGYEYLVTAYGTTRLRTPAPPPAPEERWWPPDPPEHLPDPPPDDPAWEQPPMPEVLAWTLAQATLRPVA